MDSLQAARELRHALQILNSGTTSAVNAVNIMLGET